jgi:hypothetical protein
MTRFTKPLAVTLMSIALAAGTAGYAAAQMEFGPNGSSGKKVTPGKKGVAGAGLGSGR